MINPKLTIIILLKALFIVLITSPAPSWSTYRGDYYVDPALAGQVVSSYVGRPSTKKAGRLNLLTPREQEVCRLLAYGHTSAEIAQKLCISERTVEAIGRIS